jgi:hypothetical protein
MLLTLQDGGFIARLVNQVDTFEKYVSCQRICVTPTFVENYLATRLQAAVENKFKYLLRGANKCASRKFVPSWQIFTSN